MKTSTKPSESSDLELDFSAFNYCSNEATPAQLSNLAGFLEGFMGLNQENLNTSKALDDAQLIAYFAEELSKELHPELLPLTAEDIDAFFVQGGSLSS